MPRRGPSPRKMGPNKKGGPNSKNTRTPSPVAPPPPPPPPPAQSHQRPVSQRDVFDEMMGSEISSDNSSQEVTPALLVPLTRRKSPRFQDTTGSVASDDSSLSGTTNVTSSSEAPPSSNNGSRQQQHRRKAPAPKKTQTAALKEIAKLQRHTNPVIPKLAFARLIREILMEYSHRELRITPESLMCLQESAEVFGVQLMEDAYRCTLHRDRITLMPKDIKLAVMLRKDSVML